MRLGWKLPIVIGMLLAGRGAMAEEPHEARLSTPWGMAAFVGGGVGGFVGIDMRHIAETGGLWEVRLQLGTRTRLGVEAAYFGGLQPVSNRLGIDKRALFLTTGAEATVRGNLPLGAFTSYAVVGAGWARFDLATYWKNTSSVEDNDWVLVFPVGVGVAYRRDRLIADVRAAYRLTFAEDMVPASGSNTEHRDMDSWTVTLHGGFEF